VIDRRFRLLAFTIAGGIVLTMLVGIGVGVAPFLFGEGESCADLRGGTHRGRFTAGSTVCRKFGSESTLSVCGADGRWTHRKVERC
jgi:hypothetical protein